MMRLLRRLIPSPLISFYHVLWAVCSAIWYRHPSRELVVIGITGTKGKTTTSILTHHLLTEAGYKTGLLSTTMYKIGTERVDSVKKMTTPGRGKIQKYLRRMVHEGCTHVVLETSSQAVVQSRHRWVNYNTMLLTNLTPEHIESHGSYEAYRAAKGELFAYLRTIAGEGPEAVSVIPSRAAVLPLQLQKSEDLLFYERKAPEAFRFGLSEDIDGVVPSGQLLATNICEQPESTRFTLRTGTDSVDVVFAMPGHVNVLNALAASSLMLLCGGSLQQIGAALCSFSGVPGRMEIVAREPFLVIVDYAYEPASYKAAFQAARAIAEQRNGRIVSVIGSAGGGRDVARRPVVGRLAAELGDIVVVTNEDPYDDSPQEIIDQVAAGAREGGAQDGQTLFSVLDRKEGIRQAFSLAVPNDVVLLLGKGDETVMAVANGAHIPWSDKAAALELLTEQG